MIQNRYSLILMVSGEKMNRNKGIRIIRKKCRIPVQPGEKNRFFDDGPVTFQVFWFGGNWEIFLRTVLQIHSERSELSDISLLL